MRVFVLGGTGAIGGYVVPALVDAGHSVTALARTPAKADALSARGAEAVSVSIYDAEALAGAFRGHDAVVNLATSLPATWKFVFYSAWRDTHRVRTEGSAAVVDAALAADVPRVVQESVSMLYPDGGDSWIDESVAPDESMPAARGNLNAEANARRFREAGGDGVVLRYGLFLGAGAKHSEQLVAVARRGIGPVLGHPDGYVSSIHLADAASATVAALEVPGGTYNVVDDEPLTKRDHQRALAEAVGQRGWIRGPGRLGLLLGDRMTSLTRSLRVSNDLLRRTAGWAPRHPSAREGWAATVAALGRPG